MGIKINFEKMKLYMIKEIESCNNLEDMNKAYRKMAIAFDTFIKLHGKDGNKNN